MPIFAKPLSSMELILIYKITRGKSTLKKNSPVNVNK